MKCKLLFISLLLSGTGALASQQSGKVHSLYIRNSDGLVYVVLEGSNRSAKPPCASGNYFIIKSETSNTGRQQLAMLLAAKSSGKGIVLTGAGTCTR